MKRWQGHFLPAVVAGVFLLSNAAADEEHIPKPSKRVRANLLMESIYRLALESGFRDANIPIPEQTPMPERDSAWSSASPHEDLWRLLRNYGEQQRLEYCSDMEVFCLRIRDAHPIGVPKEDEAVFVSTVSMVSSPLPYPERLAFLVRIYELPENMGFGQTISFLASCTIGAASISDPALQEHLSSVLYQLYQRISSQEGRGLFGHHQGMLTSDVLSALKHMGKPGFDRREQLGLGRDQAICDWGLPGSGKTLKEVVQAYKKAPDVYTKMAVMDALQSGRFSPVSEEVKGIIRECVLELLAHEKNDLREYGVMYAKSFGDPTFLPKLRALAANDPHHRVVTFDTSTPDPKTGKFEFTRDVRDRYMVREKAQEAIENIEKRLAQERR